MYYIYTGYAWRPMSEDELKIMNHEAIVIDARKQSAAGDIKWIEPKTEVTTIRYYSPQPCGPDWADDELEAYCGSCDEDLMDGFEIWNYCPKCGVELFTRTIDGELEKGWI